MKKQDKRHKAQAEPPSKGMSLDAIMEQLSDLKDIAASMQTPRDGPEPTASRVAACEAATDILNALQDEGIKDPEQVLDLIHDYNALAEQYQKMHQHYEKPEKPIQLGAAYICPNCKKQLRQTNAGHCWACGKRLNWFLH